MKRWVKCPICRRPQGRVSSIQYGTSVQDVRRGDRSLERETVGASSIVRNQRLSKRRKARPVTLSAPRTQFGCDPGTRQPPCVGGLALLPGGTRLQAIFRQSSGSPLCDCARCQSHGSHLSTHGSWPRGNYERLQRQGSFSSSRLLWHEGPAKVAAVLPSLQAFRKDRRSQLSRTWRKLQPQPRPTMKSWCTKISKGASSFAAKRKSAMSAIACGKRLSDWHQGQKPTRRG